MTTNIETILYTDGACAVSSTKAGGASFVLEEYSEGKRTKLIEKALHVPDTPNNRMELLAMIEGLKACTHGPIEAWTDSEYVQLGCTVRLAKWEVNNWRGSNNKPVKNKDLWLELKEQLLQKTPKVNWIRGHDGNPLNERADDLATSAKEGFSTDEVTYFDTEVNPTNTPTQGNRLNKLLTLQ